MKKIVTESWLLLFLVLFFEVGFSVTIKAQQTLHGCVPADIARLGLHPIGRLDSTKVLHLSIGLPLRNKQAFAQLFHELYDPASPEFRQWLTPAQFTAEFGPTAQDYQAVVAFAESNGFTVTKTYPNRLLVDVSGTVLDVENTFHVKMLVYNHPIKARTFYAPDAEPSLNLATPIDHIGGLSNYSFAVPNIEVTSPKGAKPFSSPGSGPNGGYASADFRAAYANGVSLYGKGQKVGLLELDGYDLTDITTYETNTNLSGVPTPENVLIDGFNGNPDGTSLQVEATLDVEMAIAMAPASQVLVYETCDTPSWDVQQRFDDVLNRMATDDVAKQLSCSIGLYPNNVDLLADNIFLETAAQGQSFFQASGDMDAVINAIAYTELQQGGPSYEVYSYFFFPCEDSNITLVGGTQLNMTGPGGSWSSELVWNTGTYEADQEGYLGSSGGSAKYYSIPSWQNGVANSGNQGSTTRRNVPDVALTADSVYEYVAGQDVIQIGTSCAAPLWAGFTALTNEQLASQGGTSVGFLNPAIYSIGNGSQYTNCFHQLTETYTGNSWEGSSFRFIDPPGYNLCTGWGTPNGQALINALCNLSDLYFLSLASTNESASSGATWYNNNHTLERDATGGLNEVFVSGGEIFFRRSTDNGSSWNITTMLSSGNGSNDVPSIAAGFYTYSSYQLEVVWQRMIPGTSDQYQLYYVYSSNSGTSWSSPAIIPGCSDVTVSYYQSPSDGGPGPTPVVGSYPGSYLIVYAAQDGLHYATSVNSQNFNPTYGSTSGIVPGTSGMSTIWHPSLGFYNASGNQNQVDLIYDDRFEHVYSQRFNTGTGAWDNYLTPVDFTGSYNRYSSIAVDPSGNTYAVWSGENGSLYDIRFRQGYADGTWSSWEDEWNLGGNTFYPTITYYYGGNPTYPLGLDILAWENNNDIWQIKSTGQGANWYAPYILATNADAPNLTHETSTSGLPVEEFVSLSQRPYLIQTETGSQGNLVAERDSIGQFETVASASQKSIISSGAPLVFETYRAAEIYDKVDHSTLRVELSEARLATLSGDTISVPFEQYNFGDTLALSSANIFNYLCTDSITVPSNATNLSFNVIVSVDVPDTLGGGKLNSSDSSVFDGVTFGVNAFDGRSGTPLFSGQQIAQTAAVRHVKLFKPIIVSVQALRGKTLSFIPTGSVLGKFNNSDLAFSLVNVLRPASAPASGTITSNSSSTPLLPENVVLGQNYPNPFNPTTNIAYQVVKAGRVTLQVYDVLGRKVATLVSEDESTGIHVVSFDASRLASGIYFYRLTAPGVVLVKKMILVK